ncbi:MAG: alpha-ketoacid dehydrogenase subunit beta, partial [Myxococcales bacterium]|nr:alpha-ketoacid dehydrogenase subunit beta [Myxococcales bacterium]
MAMLQIREALRAAIDEEMARDERVFIMGEEVGYYDGAYKVTEGLLDKYGEKRVVDTPIAEAGFAGVGIGAAMAGLRPIVEFMTFNFSAVAFDQLLNNAAKLRHLSNGQFTLPIVFRGPNAAAHMLSSTHSQAFESFYCGFPGVKVIAVATPYDAKGLLKSAIRDDNPVIFFESEVQYALKGEVPDEEYLIPIGKADVKRPGDGVTVITWGQGLAIALAAAEQVASDGIDCEVIDLRTLRPLDDEAILASVRKTNRAVLVYHGWPYGGTGAEISDRIQRLAFDHLDAPVLRVCYEDVNMPY